MRIFWIWGQCLCGYCSRESAIGLTYIFCSQHQVNNLRSREILKETCRLYATGLFAIMAVVQNPYI